MDNWQLIVLGVLIVATATFSQYMGFLDDYYVNDDFRNLFVVENFHEAPSADLLYRYALRTVTTTYLSSFYLFARQFTSIIILGKVIGILAFLFAALMLYALLTKTESSDSTFFIMSLFVLYAWTIGRFSGGLSPAFTFPLLLFFMYSLIRRNELLIALSFILQSIFYPPVFLISIVTYLLFLFKTALKKEPIVKRRFLVVVVGICVALILLIVPLLVTKPSFGEQVSFKDASVMPEFYHGGRAPVFYGGIPFFHSLKSILLTILNPYNTGVKLSLWPDRSPLLLFLLALAFILYFKRMVLKLPVEVYLVVLASLISYVAAWALLFQLYLPARYVQYTLPLAAMFIAGRGLSLLGSKTRLLAIFALLSAFLFFLFSGHVNQDLVYCEDKEAYEYIRSLPESAVIAGHPYEMDCVALYGKRKPFIMHELIIPYFKDYYLVVKQRTVDFFEAYYAQDNRSIRNFCGEHAVTHIFVNKNHFTEPYRRGTIYTEPFATILKESISNRDTFFLENPANISFQSGTKYVIDCGADL